jgi:KAP-like P-loop domain-containing protein
MATDSFKILLDVPSLKPELGFPQTAGALGDIIEESEPQFAIGIFGGWGSGKTTLMRAIERGLDPARVVPVQFSAWRYEKEQHLIVPLLDTVREALVKWSDSHESEADKHVARRTAATVGKAMSAIVAGFSMNIGVPGAVKLSYDANKSLERATSLRRSQQAAAVPRSFYHASFRALEQAFEEFVGPKSDRRIVVFVDDLDRCLPESALEVLESMKLFFDLRGFIFVVGLDRAVVEYFVEYKYRLENVAGRQPLASGEQPPAAAAASAERFQITGTDYIKKIFQVPFTLAPVGRGQLDEFLAAVYRDGELSPAQLDVIKESLVKHLRYLVRGSGVNPREIKRYINAYTLQRMIKGNLDADIMLALQTIEFQPDWPSVRVAFYTYRELFTRALSQQLDAGQPTALDDLDPELGPMPDDFIEYVSSDAPAHALLEATSLDEYIYSSAATQSTQNLKLLDGIRDIGEIYRGLRQLAADNVADEAARDGLKSQAYRMSTTLPSAIRGPLASLIKRDLDDLALALDTPMSDPVAVPQGLPAWYSESERLVRALRRRVLDIYQESDTGVAAG